MDRRLLRSRGHLVETTRAMAIRFLHYRLEQRLRQTNLHPRSRQVRWPPLPPLAPNLPMDRARPSEKLRVLFSRCAAHWDRELAKRHLKKWLLQKAMVIDWEHR